MQIKINSWDECPINTYYKIADCLSEDAPAVDRNIRLLSILCDVDEQRIWELPLGEVGAMLDRVSWINSFDFDTRIRLKFIKIDGKEYNIVPDLFDFTVAQYVDFQTYWKDRNHKLAEMLSVFIIPSGKKYNQGYDLLEVQKLIGDNLPITTAQSICFFFMMRLANSIRALQIYLDWETERMKKRMTDPERIAAVTQAQKKMKSLMEDFYGSLS